eukprot:COSAG01_NODE_6636_length_3568_cov_5.432113_5_plen_101_part_00
MAATGIERGGGWGEHKGACARAELMGCVVRWCAQVVRRLDVCVRRLPGGVRSAGQASAAEAAPVGLVDPACLRTAVDLISVGFFLRTAAYYITEFMITIC